jgi:hypothetical protein
MSKYLRYVVIFNRHIYTPNINLEPGAVERTAAEGLVLLTTCIWVVIDVRLIVSIIILANPMRMVMMIPKDRTPPVSVLYYNSSS